MERMSIHLIKQGARGSPRSGNCRHIVQDGANPLQIISNYEGRGRYRLVPQQERSSLWERGFGLRFPVILD
jgi:hypothetical protein